MESLQRHTVLLLLLVSLSFHATLLGQTVVWQETFDSYTNGTTQSTTTPAWTAYQNAGAPNGGTGLKAGGIFAVDNGTLLARNVVNNATGRTIGSETGLNPNWVVWQSEVIDISAALTGIRVFAEVSSATVAELEANDYIRPMYSVDGGPFQQFSLNGLVRGDFGNLITASDCNPIIFGNTLQIRFEIANTTVNEFYQY